MNKYDILNQPLPSESHESEELKTAIAGAEALGYGVAIKIGARAKEIARIDKAITSLYTTTLLAQKKELKVSQAEAAADSAVADLVEEKALLEAEVKYYKHVQHLIENRCSVGQSFLSNTTSQIKAGINLPTPSNY